MAKLARMLLVDNHQLLHGSIRNLLAATPDLELVREAALLAAFSKVNRRRPW